MWKQITGVDPQSSKMYFSQSDVYSMNQELKKSLLYDPTQLATALLLKHYLEEYMSSRKINMKVLLDDFDEAMKTLNQCKDLRLMLQSEDITEQLEKFRDSILQGLAHNQVDKEETLDYAKSEVNLAYLRRDALRSINSLTHHQFTYGKPETDKPVMYKQVHQYWDVNVLIQNARKMKSGISLNLIVDPKADDSYFAFVYRNGDRIGMLCDIPEYAHPLQKDSGRARYEGRKFNERIESHQFPYSLMNIHYGDNGRAYVHEKKDSTEISSSHVIPMKSVKDLEPNETIWAIMMFSLIEDKIFKQGFQAAELSYTGSMVRVNAAEQPETTITVHNALELPYLTVEDVLSDDVVDEWQQAPSGHNEWLVQRYKDKVPAALLNMTTEQERSVYLFPKHLGSDSNLHYIVPRLQNAMLTLEDPSYKPSYNSSYDIIQANGSELQKNVSWSMDRDRFLKKAEELAKLNTSEIGSANEIVSNMRFMARYNYAKIIQLEADHEFVEREKEILNWYQQALRNNLPNLLHAVAHHQLVVPAVDENKEDRNLVKVLPIKTNHYRYGMAIHSGSNRYDSKYMCIVNHSPATLMGLFFPTSKEDVALLCGCAVNQLPDVLQHWSGKHISGGNHLLNRLDPLDWAINDPWEKLNLNVCVFLSKSAYNELRKKEGLPANKFWIDPEEKKKKEANRYIPNPQVGQRVEFHVWSVIDHNDSPPRPWLGEVLEVHRKGRVNGEYMIKRDHDQEIVRVTGRLYRLDE
jgi:hypothetical protein